MTKTESPLIGLAIELASFGYPGWKPVVRGNISRLTPKQIICSLADGTECRLRQGDLRMVGVWACELAPWSRRAIQEITEYPARANQVKEREVQHPHLP